MAHAPTPSRAGAPERVRNAGAEPSQASSAADAEDLAEWAGFRDRFMTRDGRIVDTANGGISHSEGQGYAMLLATWAGDRDSFERLLAWTQAHLARPRDALFAWRWRPNHEIAVPDMNSATDGDIAIAWALQRAAERWAVPAWAGLATLITRDLLRLSVLSVGGRTVLLPGANGFARPDRVTVNPSYYNLPALRSLARLAPDPAWAAIAASANWLLDTARFGQWSLPADWVDVARGTGSVSPALGWPARFSWDAIRVPLHLCWAGRHEERALAAAASFWAHPPAARAGIRAAAPTAWPAWIDLDSGGLAPYAAHAGVVAVIALTLAARSGDLGRAALPAQVTATDYYGAALVLLSRVARQEGRTATAAVGRPRVSA